MKYTCILYIFLLFACNSTNDTHKKALLNQKDTLEIDKTRQNTVYRLELNFEKPRQQTIPKNLLDTLHKFIEHIPDNIKDKIHNKTCEITITGYASEKSNYLDNINLAHQRTKSVSKQLQFFLGSNVFIKTHLRFDLKNTEIFMKKGVVIEIYSKASSKKISLDTTHQQYSTEIPFNKNQANISYIEFDKLYKFISNLPHHVKKLIQDNHYSISIVGYADDTHSKISNLELSIQRAKSISRYLKMLLDLEVTKEYSFISERGLGNFQDKNMPKSSKSVVIEIRKTDE